MTTDPTEQEIVARAIEQIHVEQEDGAFGPLTEEDCAKLAQAAISALDQYRAKNAGEVERECAEIIDRNKMYMDGFDGKNELVVGPLNLRWRVEEATDQLSKAANLISSMRSVIEEKDRTLDQAISFIEGLSTMPILDADDCEMSVEDISANAALELKSIRARSTISDGVK